MTARSVSPWPAASPFDEDDEVVEELDVYCSGALDVDSKVYLLQFPLRPPDRPYDNVSAVRLKPRVQRMQWDLALDSRSVNWTPDAPEHVHITTSTLDSRRVDPDMRGLAVGLLRGSALHLLPVDEVLQLRHSAAYLDKEKEREKEREKRERVAAGASANGGAVGGAAAEAPRELQPLKVTVAKHETEQQVEARLRSYAYLAAQEAADVWVELTHRPACSQQAERLLRQLPARAAAARSFPHTFDRSTYLDAIVPSINGPIDPSADDATEPSPVPQQQQRHGKAGLIPAEIGRPPAEVAPGGAHGLGAPCLTPEAVAALPQAVQLLFNATPVLSLDTLRTMMAALQGHEAINHAARTASNPALHAALMEEGSLLCLRETYLQRRVGSPQLDPLRDVLLELLHAKEAVRKADVQAAAAAKGVPFAESVYQRVMHALCISSGSVWRLKTGQAS